MGCKEVVEPYYNPEEPVIELALADSEGGVEALETTPNHPFYVEGRGFVRVDELNVGDRIPDAHGGHLEVDSIVWTDRIETVYNFGVRGFHTYFVGEVGAWVHNCKITFGGKTWDWVRRSAGDAICSSGCEKAAVAIQNKIGGEIVRITPKSPYPRLGKVDGRTPGGQGAGWTHHEADRKSVV